MIDHHHIHCHNEYHPFIHFSYVTTMIYWSYKFFFLIQISSILRSFVDKNCWLFYLFGFIFKFNSITVDPVERIWHIRHFFVCLLCQKIAFGNIVLVDMTNSNTHTHTHTPDRINKTINGSINFFPFYSSDHFGYNELIEKALPIIIKCINEPEANFMYWV